MPKKMIIIFTFSISALLILLVGYFIPKINNTTQESTSEESPISSTESSILARNEVSYNGWLTTDGYTLKNEKGDSIQLRGVSSHGIEWFSDLITYENLQELKSNWNINVFRIAMYTDSNGSGYVFSPNSNKETAYNIIDMLIDLDMYVVIDWHILTDNNPQMHIEEAKSFFEETSSRYSNVPNVIYEICNEPNGNDVTWDNSVKPYSETIIPIIRSNSEKSLIIVGTPDWCKDLSSPANNPLNYPNIVYSCHFYSGTHGSELRNKIDNCISQNIPVFVSECGLTDASGNGSVYYDEFKEWINYLNSKNISWIYWSFSNKNESSAILQDTYIPAPSTSSKENTQAIANADLSTPAQHETSITNPTKNNAGNTTANTTDISRWTQENSSNSITYKVPDDATIPNMNEYLTESGKFIKDVFLSYEN